MSRFAGADGTKRLSESARAGARGSVPPRDDTKRKVFPGTRYQGSKRKLADRIVSLLRPLEYTTVLDAFGGTGAVSHAFKHLGKQVTYNDVLAFNHQVGLALVENDSVQLTEEEINRIGQRQTDGRYNDFIERTFEGIYFTADENRWLDTAAGNVRRMPGRFKRAVAWFALFQSAMAKRPYNLFHRRNLYMRTAEVRRSFGNKASWDRSFDEHFRTFAREANEALLDTGGICRALCRDAMDVPPEYDLVYIDTPYISASGHGVDYRDFYHFLEGMVRGDEWAGMIDETSKHRRLVPQKNPWCDPTQSPDMFGRLFEHFRNSVLVVSYRDDGTPSIDELTRMLNDVKRHVEVITLRPHQYALSTRRSTCEVLLIGS